MGCEFHCTSAGQQSMMTRDRTIRRCTFAVLSIWVTAARAAEETPPVQLSTVDNEALTFAVGPAAKFGLTVNGRTHQQDALLTCRGHQYTAYVDSNRRICIGRRKLPGGPWEVIHFTDHQFQSNDSHNTVVIGICASDGTIHLAFDHHATPLNYRVSRMGVAHRPDSLTWDANLFGPIMHSLGSVATPERVTYPRFFSAPNGNLMFFYRAVTSADGDGMIEEYDGQKHAWTPELGKFIARDIGLFEADGEQSLYRCPYMNALSFSAQRLHASWVWRDRFERTNATNQHDLCYAYSDDLGRTWHNSDGTLIGRTGQQYIHLNTPGVVVAKIPTNFSLSNQNTHFAYPDGSIHVVLRHRLAGEMAGTWERRYFHYWRDRDGKWSHEVLPFVGKRPKLLGTSDRTLVLVYTNEGEMFLAKGVPKSDRTRWEWISLKPPNRMSAARRRCSRLLTMATRSNVVGLSPGSAKTHPRNRPPSCRRWISVAPAGQHHRVGKTSHTNRHTLRQLAQQKDCLCHPGARGSIRHRSPGIRRPV